MDEKYEGESTPAHPYSGHTALEAFHEGVRIIGAQITVIGGSGHVGTIDSISGTWGDSPGALIQWAVGRTSYWYLRDLKLV